MIQCYILQVLMYGCEAWTINKDMEKRIDTLEMWLYRRLMKIPWKAKRMNGSILCKTLTVKSKIRKQQANFFWARHEETRIGNLITTARVLGKRSQGRPRKKILAASENGQEKSGRWTLSQRRRTESCGGT